MRLKVGSFDKTMTDKPDPSTPDAGKRPHATLDLKAIEVKGTSMVPPLTPAAAIDKDGPAKPVDTKPAEAKAGDTKSSEPKSSGPSKPAETNMPPKGPSPEKAMPPPVGVGKPRIVTHLLAGLAGGALALLGADQAAPLLGLKLPGSAIQETANDLQKRIAALEAAAKAGVRPAEQIAELSSRLGKVDETAAAVKALETAQASLVAEAKAAAADAVKEVADANAGERLQKLEERLATLSAAAGTDADKGRIQGLAAVTGKVSDLESGFNTKLNEVRKGLIIELEARLAAASEASEKARTGTERLDRELAGLKTDAARLGQNIEVQKSESERLAATVQVVQEDSAKLTSALTGLKSAVDTQLSSVARPSDVASAISPVSEKLSALELNLAAIVKSEDERKVSAERIVVTLELANLKRALERGQGYAKELADVRKAATGKVDLSVLDRYQETGVKTLPELQKELSPIISAAIDAESAVMEGSVMDRLLAGAKSAVRVRKVSHDPDDKSAEAVMARIETALNDGQLESILTLAKELPPRAAPPVQDWLAKVEARHAVDTAIAAVEEGLKASLTGKKADASGSAQPVETPIYKF